MLPAVFAFALVLSLSSATVLPHNQMSFAKLANRQGIPIPSLPERLIVGYANWNECDRKILDAVKQGVNVMMWFSINLATTPDGKPTITNGPNMDCVADIVREIRELGLHTVHLISIGGWNSPHPDTTISPDEAYEYWNYWNRNIAARPEKGFLGFDGFDWDIEGNDDPNSPYNTFTVECLDYMGKFSQLAKEQDNYVVSMAPAESYMDPTMGSFDRSLLHNYAEWEPIVPNFNYHGLNCYAYIFERYGKCASAEDPSKKTRNTFDFVTIQLYEGYSHAEYNTTQLGVPAAEYVTNWVPRVLAGWDVDFSTDAALNYPVAKKIQIDASQLVVGLANGWAGDGKFFLMYPEQAERAYSVLQQTGQQPRGFAFWNILDEGRESAQRPRQPLWMAAGLNRFLKTRPES